MVKQGLAILSIVIVMVYGFVALLYTTRFDFETDNQSFTSSSYTGSDSVCQSLDASLGIVSNCPRMRRDYFEWRRSHNNKLPTHLPDTFSGSSCSPVSAMVTGLPRSGTTITGNFAAALSDVRQLREPGNPDSNAALCPAMPPTSAISPFKGQFQVIGDDVPESDARHFFDSIFNGCCIPGERILLKDPTMINSAEWFYRHYGMRMVVTLRHPAGIINSWHSLGWGSVDEMITLYIRLMSEYLMPLWQKHHTDDNWMFIKHEDICRQPEASILAINEFTRRQTHLDFESQEQLVDYALSMTQGDDLLSSGHKYVKTNLLAEAQLNVWLREMDDGDIAKVKRRTKHIWQFFYTEADWHPEGPTDEELKDRSLARVHSRWQGLVISGIDAGPEPPRPRALERDGQMDR